MPYSSDLILRQSARLRQVSSGKGQHRGFNGNFRSLSGLALSGQNGRDLAGYSGAKLLRIHDNGTAGGLTTSNAVLKYREIPVKPVPGCPGLRIYDPKVARPSATRRYETTLQAPSRTNCQPR